MDKLNNNKNLDKLVFICGRKSLHEMELFNTESDFMMELIHVIDDLETRLEKLEATLKKEKKSKD